MFMIHLLLQSTEATEEIAKVAEHINENIRQHENFQKMLSIQKSFTGEGAPKILAPGKNCSDQYGNLVPERTACLLDII